jgi:hypothetical protein
MRSAPRGAVVLLVSCLVPLAACGADEGPQSTAAFKITSSDITLQPGEETTKCFYFHTPNTAAVQINKWVSDMTPGSHHLIAFTNLGTQPADGVVDDCESSDLAAPVYGSQLAHEEMQFPMNDGFGKPLAQQIEPGTAGYLQMHYINKSDEVLVAHVDVEAYALPGGTEFTRTDAFVAYNRDIAIPPNATNFKVSATCEIFDKKFWQVSTHAHQQAAGTRIVDGASEVFTSDDWEHPGTREWRDPEFFQFGTQITWECTYNNTGENASRTVYSGQSARTNEMCVATGYFFPAVGPRGCFKSGGTCDCVL